MKKSKIKEEGIASEIIQYREQEGKLQMELMMEKQIMGDLDDNCGENDSLQINSQPQKDEVFANVEKQQIQEASLVKSPIGRELAAQIEGESMAELGGEVLVQSIPGSALTGMKRKAELSATASDKETASIASKDSQKKWYCSLCQVSAKSAGALNLHLHGKKHKAKEATSKSNETENSTQLVEQEKTQVAQKWECSLCKLSVSSEMLLTSHLQGKKHKARVAKFEFSQNMSETHGHCTEKPKDKSEEIEKWFCSLCQVSASSGKNLNDHLQGKKHKAKEGSALQETANVGCNSNEKVSEVVKIAREKSLVGGESLKNKNETSNTSTDSEDVKSVHKTSVDKGQLEERGNQNQETSRQHMKYWHCKTCNEGTSDEAAMAAHRKSSKHMSLLRKNGGGVIVVSSMMKEATEGGEGPEDAATI